MTNNILLLLVAVSTFATCAYGWWDEGHMLVGAVAKLQLTEKEIQTLEAPLWMFDQQWPELNSIVTSAIWNDKIKCFEPKDGKVPDYCRGTPSLDDMSVFSDWHFTTHVYYPVEADIPKSPPPAHLMHPFPGTGAVWALQRMLGNNIQVYPRELADGSEAPHFQYMSPPGAMEEEEDIGARMGRSLASPNTTFPISPFTWNLHLRLVIHLMGDLHQPLHTVSAFPTAFIKNDTALLGLKDGDLGGNYIKFKHDKYPTVSNLHAFWDAGAGAFDRSFPDVTEAMALEKAAELIKEVNLSNDVVLEALSFEQIWDESFAFAKNLTYATVDWAKINENSFAPVTPSDEYIAQAQEACKKRVVVAGMRLAIILKDLAHFFDNSRWSEHFRTTGSASTLSVSMALAVIAAAAVASQ